MNFVTYILNMNSSRWKMLRVDILIFYSVFHGMYYNVSLYMFSMLIDMSSVIKLQHLSY